MKHNSNFNDDHQGTIFLINISSEACYTCGQIRLAQFSLQNLIMQFSPMQANCFPIEAFINLQRMKFKIFEVN